MRRLVLSLTTAGLLGLLVIAPSAPGGPPPECPPDAPPDFTCVITIDEQFTDTETCDFPIELTLVGRILYTPHFDREGNLVFEAFRPNIRITATANGRTLTDRDVGLDKARFLPDGSIEVLSTGIHFKVRTDDNRTIFRRIGLQIIRIDPEGNEEIEVIGGNFQPFEDFEAIICGFFAGTG